MARAHPGELLWRDADDPDTTWHVGASRAADARDADVARFHAIQDAARERRRRRRGHH